MCCRFIHLLYLLIALQIEGNFVQLQCNGNEDETKWNETKLNINNTNNGFLRRWTPGKRLNMNMLLSKSLARSAFAKSVYVWKQSCEIMLLSIARKRERERDWEPKNGKNNHRRRRCVAQDEKGFCVHKWIVFCVYKSCHIYIHFYMLFNWIFFFGSHFKLYGPLCMSEFEYNNDDDSEMAFTCPEAYWDCLLIAFVCKWMVRNVILLMLSFFFFSFSFSLSFSMCVIFFSLPKID